MRKDRLVVILLVVLTVVQMAAIRQHMVEERILENLMGQIASPSLPESQQVLKILQYLRSLPAVENSSYFLLPIFRLLRPPARSVIQFGGDCADRSRLLIRLLHTRGIRAQKWALYANGFPQHAVVEVAVEQGTMIADGLFGLWFPRESGGYYGINDLRSDPEILQRRIVYLRTLNLRPGAAKLEFYPLEKYNYAQPRTINWDGSFLGALTYDALRILFGEEIDRIPRPEFTEAPALMVIYGSGLLQGLIIAVWTAKAFRTLRPRHSKKTESIF